MQYSVVVPTWRIGGLDVLFDGLQRQTYRDFELILVDGLYDYREGVVNEHAKQYDFPVIHVAPFDNPFPMNAFCRYANTGIHYAAGNYVLFQCDYTWMPPECLQRHQITRQGLSYHVEPPLVVFGTYAYVALPRHHRMKYAPDDAETGNNGSVIITNQAKFERQEEEAAVQYVEDLKSGKLNQYMWSIFDGQYDYSQLPMVGHIDVKAAKPFGSITPDYCHLKNESFPTQMLLNANGLDEALDGTHGYQDMELAERLTVAHEAQWWNDPRNMVHIVNPRALLWFRQRVRSNASNYEIVHAKRITKYQGSVNSWNIRHWRQHERS